MFEGVRIAHDPIALGTGDVVPGVGPAARSLAWLTPRHPVARALDLGTGNGVQALLLARHAGTVVATDINPRALRYAGDNAAANGVTIDLREGDLWTPVAGERFDLVVCNPPFVIGPDDGAVFRDGGEAITEPVVRGLHGHLTDGGLGIVMLSWVHDAGTPWWERPRSFVDGVDADVLLLRLETVPAAEYVRMWVTGDDVDRWLDHLRRRGVEQIGLGYVVLRRTPGRRRLRALDIPRGVHAPCGDHLLDVLDAVPVPDQHVVLRRSPGTVVERDGASLHLRRVPGLGVRAPIDGGVLTAIDAGDVIEVTPAVRRLLDLALVARAT